MNTDFENQLKETFEHFEADVNPQTWMNIQQGLQASSSLNPNPGPNTGAAITQTSGWLAKLSTVITIGAVTAITISGIWYFSGQGKQEATPLSQTNSGMEQMPTNNMAKVENANPSFANQQPQNKAISQPDNQANSLAKNVPVTPQNNDLQNNNTGNSKEVVSSSTNVSEINKSERSTDIKIQDAITKAESENATTQKTGEKKDKNIQQLIQSFQNQPIAYIVANPISGSAPLTVNFLNNGYANEVTWNFGNETSNENQTSHLFQSPGSYLVKLTAKDQQGIVFTDEVTIIVKENEQGLTSSVNDIQNVFTPNGDGYNDVFKIKGNNIVTLDALIFNSNGKKIYHWTDPQGGWDGKIAGANYALEGSYYYIIEAKGTDGKVYQFKGSLTLIR